MCQRTGKWPMLSPSLRKKTRVQQPTIDHYPLRRFAPRSWNTSSILTSWTNLKETPSLHQHSMDSIVNAHVRLNSIPQYKTWQVAYWTATRSNLSYCILPQHSIRYHTNVSSTNRITMEFGAAPYTGLVVSYQTEIREYR